MTPSPDVGGPPRISAMLDRTARRFPDQAALVDGDVALTYEQLAAGARRAAGGFRQAGVRPGDRVGFYAAESWRHVVALYGALRAGAIVVPLNLAWEAAEIEYAFETTELSFLVAGQNHRTRDLWRRLEAAGVQAPGAQSLARYPDLRRVIPDWECPGVPSLADLIATDSDAAENDEGEVAYLMFTSGSSGRPKAAMIRSAAALRVGEAVAERLRLGSDDRVLNISPLYHCAGLVAVLIASHSRGAEVSIFEGYQHERMLEHLHVHRANVLVGFDVVTMRLIRDFVEHHGAVPVERMLSGPGRPVFDEASALGIDLAIMYGLTEASNVVSLTSAGDTRDGRRDSNGFPLDGVDVRISDPDTGREVPRGQHGEITYQGWNLMAGYYRPGATASLEVDDAGYFHTGDYGYQDDEGRVYYRGRYAGMVKTGGENVSEVEVESFLATEFQWMTDVAVLGIPDEQWGEIVVAVFDAADDDPCSSAELRDACRGRISGYKIPKLFLHMPVDQWPVSGAGKILKQGLRERVLDALTAEANPSDTESKTP